MARLFVMSDNMSAVVEIRRDDETGAAHAYCVGCVTGRDPEADDLLTDAHECWNIADAMEVAAAHADRCLRCADRDCRTEGRHDAGHRCRKDY